MKTSRHAKLVFEFLDERSTSFGVCLSNQVVHAVRRTDSRIGVNRLGMLARDRRPIPAPFRRRNERQSIETGLDHTRLQTLFLEFECGYCRE